MGPRRGYSLLEVIIALGILGTSFLMLMGIFPASLLTVKKGNDLTFATALAQEQLENARTVPYSSLTTSTQSTVTQNVSDNGAASLTTFTVTLDPTYEPVPGKVKDVKATVQWREQGLLHYVTYEEYITNQ